MNYEFHIKKTINWNNIKCSFKIGEQRKEKKYKRKLERTDRKQLQRSIITLNVNCLNIPVEVRGFQDWVLKKEQDQSLCRVLETHFNYKDSNH